MHIAKTHIIILFLAGLLSACNLFTTRNPEEPETGRSSFQQPVNADIVIDNFKNALKEKNTENYIACFWNDTESGTKKFEFTPSAEASARFPTIFETWDIDSERNDFNYLTNSLLDMVYPVLEFQNEKPGVAMPDSTVFISDYILTVNHSQEQIPKIFAGTLQFTISKGANGLWSISRWLDTSPAVDTIDATWSILKAQFYN